MLNNPDPLAPQDEDAAMDEEEAGGVDLAIKLNDAAGAYECALCGDERQSAVGPELYFADTWEMVCHDCAREHAPVLVALIDLGGAAEGYVAVRWASEGGDDGHA
jgi:hypothetical protein